VALVRPVNTKVGMRMRSLHSMGAINTRGVCTHPCRKEGRAWIQNSYMACERAGATCYSVGCAIHAAA